MAWKKLQITRGKVGSKEPLIFFSKGQAKYLRLTQNLMSSKKLEEKKSVDIFIDKVNRKVLVGFSFRDDDEGTLKFTQDKRGSGFMSGTTIFKTLAISGVNGDRLSREGKNGFRVREEKIDENKILVIEIPSE